ncbi:MAG TPA: CBS domain-containing protein [Acidimicrobiales bacterium]
MRTVAEVMSSPARTATTSDVVGPIRDLMLEGNVHGVPVLDADGTLVGIVTSSDLVEEWAPQMGVTTVMSDRVQTVSPHTSVVDAAREMLAARIHHLVVVDSSGVAGMLSSFDLLRELAGEVETAASVEAPARASAVPGDLVVIRGHAVDQKERRGVIVDTRGPDGGPPFVVRWLDDPHAEPHDVLFFPGSDADVEPATPA